MKNLLYLVFALLLIFGCGDNSSQSRKRAKDSDEKSEASKSMYGRYLYEDSRFELIMILNKDELSFTEKSETRKRGFKAKYHIKNGNIIVLDKMMGDGPKKFLNKWNGCGIKIDESGIEFWEDFSRDDRRMLFKKTEWQKEIRENPKKSSKPYKDQKIKVDNEAVTNCNDDLLKSQQEGFFWVEQMETTYSEFIDTYFMKIYYVCDDSYYEAINADDPDAYAKENGWMEYTGVLVPNPSMNGPNVYVVDGLPVGEIEFYQKTDFDRNQFQGY
jgi:hypothetical protein